MKKRGAGSFTNKAKAGEAGPVGKMRRLKNIFESVGAETNGSR